MSEDDLTKATTFLMDQVALNEKLEAQNKALVKAMDEIRSLANDAQSDEIYDVFTWIIEKIDSALAHKEIPDEPTRT